MHSLVDEGQGRSQRLNEKLFLEYDLVQNLRYGENPHQSAKFYGALEPCSYALPFARQIQGKELSYNNIQDANAALSVLRDFSEPFCVALKLRWARPSRRPGRLHTRPTR